MSNFPAPQRFEINPPQAAAKRGRGCLWWAIPLGCLGVLVICGGIGGSAWFFGMNYLKESAPYKTATTLAQNNPQVQEILGDNIQPGWAIQGKMAIENNDGSVDMSIPLTGSKGSGRVHIRGTAVGDEWHYDEIYFTSDSGQDRIDLIEDAGTRPEFEVEDEFGDESDGEAGQESTESVPDFSGVDIDLPTPSGN